MTGGQPVRHAHRRGPRLGPARRTSGVAGCRPLSNDGSMLAVVEDNTCRRQAGTVHPPRSGSRLAPATPAAVGSCATVTAAASPDYARDSLLLPPRPSGDGAALGGQRRCGQRPRRRSRRASCAPVASPTYGADRRCSPCRKMGRCTARATAGGRRAMARLDQVAATPGQSDCSARRAASAALRRRRDVTPVGRRRTGNAAAAGRRASAETGTLFASQPGALRSLAGRRPVVDDGGRTTAAPVQLALAARRTDAGSFCCTTGRSWPRMTE
jgi:hypothetical protein